MSYAPFHFKRFSIQQDDVVHPVGTDGVLLGAWADVNGAKNILDVGTGTGLIALMLAQRTENQDIEGIIGLELDEKTAQFARQNFAQSPWKNKLQLRQTSLQAYSPDRHFDLIVSNPPFFQHVLLSPDARRNMGRHAQSLPFEDLLLFVQGFLSENGRFCVILPPSEAQYLCEMAVTKGLYWTKICRVRPLPGKALERCMIQFEKQPFGLSLENLLVYEKQQQRSGAFLDLTKEFYL